MYNTVFNEATSRHHSLDHANQLSDELDGLWLTYLSEEITK
jgi:hypothetical protein